MTKPKQKSPPVGVRAEQILAVIPTMNEGSHIEATLERLLTGSSALARLQIVVADAGSQDATREIVQSVIRRHPNVRLIDNPARLQAAAINRAVEMCATPQHRILVRCDAHSLYPENYILRVAESLAARDAAALATVMDSVGESCFQRAAAWAVDTKLGSGGSAHRGGRRSGYVDHGHHAGFQLAMFRQVGGYAADFATNEDAELDHRIRQAGGRIWLDAEIRIEYYMRRTLDGLARQYWRYGRGRARTLFRHRLRPRLRQVLPVVMVCLVTLGLVLAPFWPISLILPFSYALALAAISVRTAQTRRSVCGLWSGPALGAMHLSWGVGFLWQAAVGGGR